MQRHRKRGTDRYYGARTSGRAYPVRYLATSPTSRGGRWSSGCHGNTAGSDGNASGAGTSARAGGQPRTAADCSTPARYAPRGTSTGERPSPRPDRRQDRESTTRRTGHVESPVRGQLARRVRECGPGKPTDQHRQGAPGRPHRTLKACCMSSRRASCLRTGSIRLG
jgi:hypothetical protein